MKRFIRVDLFRKVFISFFLFALLSFCSLSPSLSLSSTHPCVPDGNRFFDERFKEGATVVVAVEGGGAAVDGEPKGDDEEAVEEDVEEETQIPVSYSYSWRESV